MMMMLYATGLRRAELCHLKVSNIDSKRMVIHARQGKGGRDRDVLLIPKLRETLREYWRWMQASEKTWIANAQATPHRTSRCSIESHSTCSNKTKPASSESKESASEQAGPMNTCCNYPGI